MDKLFSDTITDRRKQTRSSIYNYIYASKEPNTKQTISRDLNLSLPTIYQNLSELMEAGLIENYGVNKSTGGRPAIGIRIVSRARCSIGIYFTNHHLRFIAIDLNSEEFAFKELRHTFYDGIADIMGFVSSELETFINEFHIDRMLILGVGFALPAIISNDGTRILFAPTLHISDFPLQDIIKALPYNVYVENDANCGGLTEWYSNPKDNMAYLLLENGVGGAIFGNTIQYLGDNKRSGEFGHMCIVPDGDLCSCGRRGCFEAYCSALRLSDDLNITISEFFKGLQANNEDYLKVWERYLYCLALGIHNIRMSLDCDIVIGGFVALYLEPYLPKLQQLLKDRNPFLNSGSYVSLAKETTHPVLRGVALHFTRAFLDSI